MRSRALQILSSGYVDFYCSFESITYNNNQKRFEDALKKLTADLEMKTSQRDELKERQRMKKEGISMDVIDDTDHDNLGNDDGDDAGDEEGDLFGDSGMDIG